MALNQFVAEIYEDDFSASSLQTQAWTFARICQRFKSSIPIKLMSSDCFLHQVIQS